MSEQEARVGVNGPLFLMARYGPGDSVVDPLHPDPFDLIELENISDPAEHLTLAGYNDVRAGRAAADAVGDESGWRGYLHGKSNSLNGKAEFGSAPYVFTVRLFAPEEWVAPFRKWLHEEHFEIQLKTPGLMWCHTYEPIDGRFHFLNIWGMEQPGLIASPEFVRIRDTPWFAEVEPMFAVAAPLRGTYQRA